MRCVIERIVTHRPGCAPNWSSDAPIGETDALIARIPNRGFEAQGRDRGYQLERGPRWVKTVTCAIEQGVRRHRPIAGELDSVWPRIARRRQQTARRRLDHDCSPAPRMRP